MKIYQCLICLDVDYRHDGATENAVAAAVVAASWDAEKPTHEATVRVAHVEPYVPGQLYRRELPCLLAVLERLTRSTGVSPSAVLVDGFVWLGAHGDDCQPRAGLGVHLHRALGGTIPVVGVAKSAFARAAPVREVLRGGSRRPLYVSAVGLPLDDAARHVVSMHGRHRLPTLLRRVDRLCRSA